MAGLSAFACVECGHRQPKWFAQCPECRTYKTPIEEPMTRTPSGQFAGFGAAPRITTTTPRAPAPPIEDDESAGVASALPIARARPIAITEIPEEHFQRVPTGLEPVDRVLGGDTVRGIVPGTLLALGAMPGCGKSTLVSQLVANIVRLDLGYLALYATGEESIAQSAMRARRVDAADSRVSMLSETNLDVIIAEAHEMRSRSKLVLVVDSINCMSTSRVAGVPGSISQVKACVGMMMELCKRHDVITIAIGHVTKDGALGGPQTLAHMVDVVMMLEGRIGENGEPQSPVRFLSTPRKNRFGTNLEIGTLEMTSKGLVACDQVDRDAYEAWRNEDVSREFEPIAQELLNRYIADGGIVDDGLRDRIAGRLDFEMWRETRYDAPVTPQDPPEGLS